MTYPYGVQIGVVRVDRDTGAGRRSSAICSPTISAARSTRCWSRGNWSAVSRRGSAARFTRSSVYDERGEPLSVTFADYLMPTLREMPPVEVLLTEDAPSPLNPLGIKSVGEGGITAVGAVIAAAIDDAIGLPGAVTRLPATPQRVKALLRAEPARRAAE